MMPKRRQSLKSLKIFEDSWTRSTRCDKSKRLNMNSNLLFLERIHSDQSLWIRMWLKRES